MKKLVSVYFLLLFLYPACQVSNRDELVQPLIEATREEFAPDKRIARFDLTWEQGVLSGETNLPEAHRTLLERLREKEIDYTDSVRLLPETDLGAAHLALVTNSVANIRSDPRHSAELATQALMGTPLKVLKKSGSWYLVQTPDEYISWVDAAAIVRLDPQVMEEWMGREKVVVTEMIGNIYRDENKNEIISDVTAGNVLELLETNEQTFRVQLPDGRTGYVPIAHAVPYERWKNSRSTDDLSLINTAKQMMGSPYLWGGTSPKGMDCSGFTKTIYFLNGKVIPRDASQQILEGELVDTEKNWEDLEVGDLLFFGVPATADTKERVVHVGMWIGENRFIHSRGRVRISSFDPDDENFDAYELDRYLRTKRIRNQPSERILSVDQILQ
jgi:SH3-like domain-containing protein